MVWRKAILLLGPMGLLVGACSSSSPDDAATSVTIQPERAFFDAVDASGRFAAVDSATLLTAGYRVCQELDDGHPPVEVLATAMDTAGDNGVVLMGLSVTTLCRDHEAEVRAQIGG